MKKKVTLIITLVACLIVTTIVFTGCGSNKYANGKVYVYDFGDYINADLIPIFEKETGIEVILDTYDSNEEMYPVIKNNSADYDIICASDYMIQKMRGEGLLAKIDFNNVPNIKNIGTKYLDMAKEFDPENKYSVPYTWGTAGILYDKTVISEGSITSWNDLWNKKYSGLIVMQDNIRDTFMVAEKALGYSLNTTKESELKAATELLIKQKPLIYKYANDAARDLLISGSASIGVVWSGEVLYCQKQNKNLVFVLPKEGTELFIDAWAIPETSKNKKNAEAWINFMCRADVAYQNFDYLTYATPNDAAKLLMSKDIQKNSAIFPSDESLKNCEVIKSLSNEASDMYSKYWNNFKSK